MLKTHALKMLLGAALLSGCSGSVSGPADLCRQAAAHLEECTGKKQAAAIGSCDSSRAQTILATGCSGRSAQSWLDDLCAFGFLPPEYCGGTNPTNPTQPTQPGTTGCGAVTDAGECNGDLLSYCDNGQLFSYQCDPGTCAMQADGYFDCGSASGTNPTQPTQPGTGCGAVTDAGECNGNVLSYCDYGQLFTYDCGAQTCQLANDGYYDCL